MLFRSCVWWVIATPPHTKKILVLYVMNGWMDGRWMTEIHEHSEFSRRPQRPQDDCILYTASVNPHSSSLCQPTKALATMTSRLYRDEDQPPLYTHTHTHTHTHKVECLDRLHQSARNGPSSSGQDPRYKGNLPVLLALSTIQVSSNT